MAAVHDRMPIRLSLRHDAAIAEGSSVVRISFREKVFAEVSAAQQAADEMAVSNEVARVMEEVVAAENGRQNGRAVGVLSDELTVEIRRYSSGTQAVFKRYCRYSSGDAASPCRRST